MITCSTKNLDDICAIIVRRDSQGLFLPKCVSVDLSNVPINDDGNPSLGQIMAAIADLIRKMVTTDMLESSLKNLNTSSCSSSSSSDTVAAAAVAASAPSPLSLAASPPESIAPLAASAPSFNEIVSASGDQTGAVGNDGGRGGGGGRGSGRGGGGRGGRGRQAKSSASKIVALI